MKVLEPTRGPVTLELALEHARKGRPDLLLLLIADTMGAEVAEVLTDLLHHPEKMRVKHQAKFLPHEAVGIRELYRGLLELGPKKPVPVVQDELANSLGISADLLRDIVYRKNTYAKKNGERLPGATFLSVQREAATNSSYVRAAGVMKLFRYREINDRTKGLIVRNEVYFPSAVQLDDIRDCGVTVDFSVADPTAYRGLLRFWLCELLKHLSLTPQKFDEIVEHHYREQSQDVEKFARDLMEGCFHATRNNKGVYSMSASPTIPKMWRLYADCHRGICVEFSAIEVINSAVKVSYVPALRAPRFFDETIDSLATEVLTTKLAGWEYQQEWRIIEKNFPRGPHTLSQSIVSGVVFGAEISLADRLLVEAWISEARLNVQLYQAQLTEHVTLVEVQRI